MFMFHSWSISFILPEYDDEFHELHGAHDAHRRLLINYQTIEPQSLNFQLEASGAEHQASGRRLTTILEALITVSGNGKWEVEITLTFYVNMIHVPVLVNLSLSLIKSNLIVIFRVHAARSSTSFDADMIMVNQLVLFT